MKLRIAESGSFVCDDDPGEPGYRNSAPRHSVSISELPHLIDLCRGKRVLEIGTGLGISTQVIAAVSFGVATIDPDPWVQNEVFPRLRALGVVCSPCRALTATFIFDVVIIDGNHSQESVESDARYALSIGAREIIFHDFNSPSVREGARRAGLRDAVIIPTVHGIGVFTVREQEA